MNSKIEISTRAAGGACVLSLFLLLASACSGSRSALSTEPLGAAVTASASEKSNLAACGSMTKPCDPNNLGGQTCASLGAGSGTLLCDPVTCSFDRSMCTGAGTQGGGGLGALLGAFGRAQGGRSAMMNTMGMGRGGRGAMAMGGRGGSTARREDGQMMSEERREEGGSGGEKAEGGDKAEGGAGGETSNPAEMTAGAGGDSAMAAGAGGDMSAAGAGGEAGAAAAMSEMPMQMMPAPEMPNPPPM